MGSGDLFFATQNPTKDFSLVGLLLFPQNDAEHTLCKKQYCVRAICAWWRWRESNPRPKAHPHNFLRAYPVY